MKGLRLPSVERKRLLVQVAIAGVLCVTRIYGQQPRDPSKLMKYPSPDGSLVAIVASFHKTGGTVESEVELQTRSGQHVAQHSYTSRDSEHGFGVVKAQWTPNSRYFVFSLVSSGGHQPWHSPVQFFSRKDNSLLSLDDALNGAVMNPEFAITAPEEVTVHLYPDKTATVSLSTLQRAR